jgi:hypothetical protein
MNGNDPHRATTGAPSYCSLECASQCPVFKATVTDDRAAKQAVADIWTRDIGELFTADDVFCAGCKQEGVPQNRAVHKCTVRQCAQSKRIGSCTRCAGLAECKKYLWQHWPDIREQALVIQRATRR